MGQQQDLAENRAFVEAATLQFRKELEAIVAAYREAGRDVWTQLGDPKVVATRALRAAAEAAATEPGEEGPSDREGPSSGQVDEA